MTVDLVKAVNIETLPERYALYYGVTITELKNKLKKRYPNDEELYIIMFHLIK